MDTLQIILTTATTSLTSAIVGAIVAASIAYVKDSKKSHDDRAEAQYELDKETACDKARELADEAIEAGCITINQRARVKTFTSLAHRLGANGEMTEIENVVDALPTVG